MPPRKQRKNRQQDVTFDDIILNSRDRLNEQTNEVAQIEVQAPPKRIMDTQFIALLPSFGGNGDSLQFFIQQFNQIAAQTNWSEEQKTIILKLKLKDGALKLVTNNSKLMNSIKTEEIFEALRERYEPTKTLTQKLAAFRNLSYESDMQITDLAAAVEDITQNFLGIDDKAEQETKEVADKVKLGKFLELIDPDIKTQLRTEGINSYNAAVNRAKELQIIYSEVAQTTNTLRTHNANDNSHAENTEINSLRREIENLKIELHANKSKKVNFCKFCDKVGHSLEECRSLQKVKQKNTSQVKERNSRSFYSTKNDSFRGNSRYNNSRRWPINRSQQGNSQNNRQFFQESQDVRKQNNSRGTLNY